MKNSLIDWPAFGRALRTMSEVEDEPKVPSEVEDSTDVEEEDDDDEFEDDDDDDDDEDEDTVTD